MAGENYKDFLKKNFFDETYSIKYDKWRETPFSAYIEKRQMLGFSELMNEDSGERILDIGAGTGKYELLTSKMIKGKGRNGFIIALDFSENMLKKLRRNLNKINPSAKVFLVRGDAEKLPFKKNAFDTVFSMNTLQYVPNDKNFFDEAYRVLNKKGLFVVDALSLTELRLGHNLALVWDQVRRVFGKKSLNIYKQFYTTKSLRSKASDAGFKVERCLGAILSLPWITREHVGITLPSPQHIIIFFPSLFNAMEYVEDRIKEMPLLKGLCTHLMIKCRK